LSEAAGAVGPMSQSAVAVEGLVKRFGPVVALAGVDFSVPAGTVLAVLGPNGAGKSTLLRLLAGLARPSAGRVRIGADGGDDRRQMRGRVGYVGHATFLYGNLSARENLIFAARLYGVAEPARRADALLAEQGLEALAARPAGSLSRGQAQRLAIARGLVHDPPVVLLDEPFTGLDPTSADRLGARLRALAAAGRAVVLVTHDLAQAAALGDRALLLVRGRVAHDSGATAPSAAALEAAWRTVGTA
jgi:heme ABC exporter ATP-binding subunit CcmA